ncbi:hypothetical protein Naga_101787g1 [Nannochloropsis gaditana]|uniref:Uncharacterized protein n=1 Tax=Nannochloropsis gaditana TaxID=72520 RepID=W7TB09_9STRA|nr:hypothetical protein Naga_101787g1 [Nannochloropsis gaditana]
MAQEFLQAFTRVHREGDLDRAKVIQMLNIWQNMSIIAAADVSCGLTRAIAELLHLPSTDLALLPPFLPPFLASRAFQTQRAALILHARERAARAKEGKGSQSLLKESVAWMMADDGVVPLLMMCMDGPHMLLQTTNRPYDKLVAGAQSLHEHCLRKKTIQFLLMASLISPDDRSLWFRCLAHSLFTSERYRHVAVLVKLFDAQGQMRLYLHEASQVQLGLVCVYGLV